MIVLSGASASGKTEVAKVLAAKYGIVKMITTTTRPIRINEVDGRDYFFVTKERFLEMIKQNLFVEYTNYNNNLYGSTKDQIKNDRCVVIDPTGLKAYIALNEPSIVTFFLESTEETRYQRMLLRGDKKEDAEARILNDRNVFTKENLSKVDYVIDSEHPTIEELAKEIVNKYEEALKNRGVK